MARTYGSLPATFSVTTGPAPSLAVDARALYGSGIGRYTREIVRGLAEGGRFSRVTLVGNRAELEAFIAEAGIEAEILPIRGGRYSLGAQASWMRLLFRAPIADVVLFPHWDVPVIALPSRSVVTVHDLILLRAPGATSPVRRAVARAMLGRVAQGANRIITDSAYTRDDFVGLWPRAAGKVEVVPLAAAALFFKPPPPLSLLPAGVTPPYLLCVANRKAHKNLGAAVEVLVRLLPRFPALRLVVAGERFPAWRQTLDRARRLGVEPRIVDLEAVRDEELHALYAHAEALIFPSYAEGFGFPVLEAMASGTPVVASNATAIPEVAGAAALLVGPDDIAAMSDAVEGLLTDRAHRDRLIRAGRERAAGFTWERTVEATQRILLEVAAA